MRGGVRPADRRARAAPLAALVALVTGCGFPDFGGFGGAPPQGHDGGGGEASGPDEAGARDAATPDASPPTCDCAPSEICVAHQCRAKGALAAPTFAACTSPPCMNVYNNCTIPLWTHAIGTIPIDGGEVRALAPGAQYQYAGLSAFGGGRLYAYYQQPSAMQSTTAPVSTYNQFVEMSVDTDASNGNAWAQNYDISYVDYLALPVSVQAENGCPATTCGSQFGDWVQKLQECPTSLLNVYQGVGTCVASYDYCVTADGATTNDQTKTYCTKMQAAHGYPGSAVYGGVFPSEPSTDVAFWDGVAAWNRGTFAGDANSADYYKAEPYNDYAGMIHDEMGCSLVYAFSTDDHQDQSGFIRCDSPVLDVVWCPYLAP
jgi:Beta-1,3-glucanase